MIVGGVGDGEGGWWKVKFQPLRFFFFFAVIEFS